jgi:hypothetical protein
MSKRPASFDELYAFLLEQLQLALDLNPSEMNHLKVLLRPRAGEIPDGFIPQAFQQLWEQGLLDPRSALIGTDDATARLCETEHHTVDPPAHWKQSSLLSLSHTEHRLLGGVRAPRDGSGHGPREDGDGQSSPPSAGQRQTGGNTLFVE